MPKTLPRNGDLADQLDLLADLSEILEEESFKVIAYRRAAGRIRESPLPVAELALDGKAKELPGIGKTIENKVVEVVEDGEMHALTKRRELVPAGVVDFLRLPGVGPKTAARIWTQLGITSLDGLKTAAQEGRLRELSGMGARSEEKILKALEAGVGEVPEERHLLARALPAVRRVVDALAAHPSAIAVSEAGSVRRRRETVRDARSHRDLQRRRLRSSRRSARATGCPRSLARGDTKATVVGHDGLRFDLRVVPADCYGNVLQHFTGSKDHNVALREDAAAARALDLRVRRHRASRRARSSRMRPRTSSIGSSGYAPIPPELREGTREIAAARGDGALPALVEVGDLEGEMHCHSTWSSDGKGSIEEMALTAKGRGYRFLCMTDHSHYLRDGRLEAQWKEIEELNGRLTSFRVLRGIEVNIRADGSLDVDDDVLARARLGRRVAPHVVRPQPDRADPGCDGQSARRLHRPPHGASPPEATGRTGRRRAGRRACGRDGHGPRDQLAARSARHARRARATGRRGGGADPDHDRRALGRRARLRGARCRPGAPCVAHEGTDPEHSLLARDRQTSEVSGDFREDGALALDWVASYLERVGDFPVLSQVEPGAVRAALPATPPDEPEPFASVVADLDSILLPGITHWQSPRFFAYFATTGSEPGVLAELLIAGLNQVGILWRTSPALQELEELTVDWLRQLLGLPEEFRGHIEDTASTGVLAATIVARSRQPDRRVLVCSEHAHSVADKAARLLDLELRKVPTDDEFRLRPDLLDARRRLRGHRDGRDDGHDRGRSRARDRRALRRSGNVAARRRRLRGRRQLSARSSVPTSRAGSAPTRSA